MSTYSYIARNASGDQVTGTMDAESEALVLRSLDEKLLFPIRVQPQQPSALTRGGGVRVRDLGVMYSQLADLMNAGVPVLRSLKTLTRTASRKPMKQSIEKLADEVASGASLVDAMNKQPEVFPHLHGAMIRAGERGGFVEQVLTNLSEFLERQDELRSKVRGAVTYPIILTFVGVCAMVFILLALVPKFKPMFEDMALPFPTKVLFACSDILIGHWLMLLLVMMGCMVFGFIAAVRSEAGRFWWDRLRMRLPGVGGAMRMVAITRFCRILGTMLVNGVPILQALAISKDATGSVVLAEAVAEAQESVRAGQSLAEPLRKCSLFPPEILEMIAVAEESNQLEKVLVKISDTVERRTNRQVDQAVGILEPVILTLLAGAIAFMAMGLIVPIFKMSQTLN